jgi:hypothetical protein
MLGAIVADRLVGTVSTRPVAVVGLALVAIGNGLLVGVSGRRQRPRRGPSRRCFLALGGGPLFDGAATSALGRASLHEAGLVSGIVQTFDQLGAAICVAAASTVAAAALTRAPSIDGFTDAFTVFTVVAAVAAVLSLRLVPPGKPPMTGAPIDPAWAPPPITGGTIGRIRRASMSQSELWGPPNHIGSCVQA